MKMRINMQNPIQEYFDFATKLAYEAGRVTLSYFMRNTSSDIKDDGSPVTIADREAEKYIRLHIERTYPTHSILGEEMGRKEGESVTYRWIVDPIDGTQSFIRGVPLYSTLLALEIEGKVEVGVA